MLRNLDEEIKRLKKKILILGTMAEESVSGAVKSIGERDANLAEKIIKGDSELDSMDVNIEENCLKVLALYQPVAIDLRFVTSVIKITSDLERIGDLAVNIAKQSIRLAKQESIDIPFDFSIMAYRTQEMLKKSLDALVNRDPGLAIKVCALDDEIDIFNRETYAHVQEGIRSKPEKMKSLFSYLSVSRYLERIADHATNIAEDVVYMVEGEIIRHKVNSNETKDE